MKTLENKVRKEIEKQKRKLVAKAKKSGLYENFGQQECNEIERKFNINSYDQKTRHCYYLIREFDNWCMNFDLSCIK